MQLAVKYWFLSKNPVSNSAYGVTPALSGKKERETHVHLALIVLEVTRLKRPHTHSFIPVVPSFLLISPYLRKINNDVLSNYHLRSLPIFLSIAVPLPSKKKSGIVYTPYTISLSTLLSIHVTWTSPPQRYQCSKLTTICLSETPFPPPQPPKHSCFLQRNPFYVLYSTCI